MRWGRSKRLRRARGTRAGRHFDQAGSPAGAYGYYRSYYYYYHTGYYGEAAAPDAKKLPA